MRDGIFLAAVLVAGFLAGCNSGESVQVSRTSIGSTSLFEDEKFLSEASSSSITLQGRHFKKSLTMALDESKAVTPLDKRVGVQVKIAKLQLLAGYKEDLFKTLEDLCRTLDMPPDKDFEPYRRVSGWLAVSEFAIQAGGKKMAEQACDKAAFLLSSVEEADCRTALLMAVASQIRQLRGDKESVQLLHRSFGWLGELDQNQPRRREVIEAVAANLLECDDYEGVKAVLAKDPDPLWRTETMAWLTKLQQSTTISGPGYLGYYLGSYYYLSEGWARENDHRRDIPIPRIHGPALNGPDTDNRH